MKTTEEIETKRTTKYPEILSILKELYKYGFRAGSKPNSEDESMDWSGAYNRIEQIINQNFIGKEEVNIEVLEGKKDILKEIVLEFEGNRLEGKGYDFYLSINDKLNKLLELLK